MPLITALIVMIDLPNDQTEPTAGAGVSVETAVRVGVKIEHLRHQAPAVGSSAWFALVLAVIVLLMRARTVQTDMSQHLQAGALRQTGQI